MGCKSISTRQIYLSSAHVAMMFLIVSITNAGKREHPKEAEIWS